MSIPIIGKEEDVEGCVSAPVLLQEVLRSCSESEPLKKPIVTMLQIFAEFAQYASERNEPELNIIALRLGLFPMPQDKLRKALDCEYKTLKALYDASVPKVQKVPSETDVESKGESNG
jgi:hypothetical protein